MVGAGQWGKRCRSVSPAARVSGVSGAGQCTQRCRSDFALLTCARNRHSGPFSGAGPHHQIGPAPSTAPTCTIHRTHLRRPHPHAPLTCPHLRPPPVEESPAVHFPRGWVPQTNQRLLRERQTGRHETRTAVQSGRKSPPKIGKKNFFLYDRLKQHKKHVKQHFFSTEPCFYRA